jgi:hypothetical protein
MGKKVKPMIYRIEFPCGDIIVLEAEDPLKAAIMASSDRIRAKKPHHIKAIEYNGERAEGFLYFAPAFEDDL